MAAMEYFRLLLLHDIICSQRITMHFHWGGYLGENLSLVAFDL